MKISNVNSSSCRKCLQLSLPVEMMIRLARLVNPKYDIYRRTGLKEGMPISNQSAAQRIVADMVLDGFFIDFVEVLIKIDADGYMGRRYNLYGLNDVVTGLIQEGYVFDKISGQFFENQQERISPNWGRLKEGDERKMTLLKFDIAGNSVLVRNNPDAKIGKAYNDLRTIVNRAVTSRFGRLWTWEGDGALGAFLFGSQEKMAVFAGMEILHELFFYNRLRNPLDSPVNVRVGIHIGQIRYSAHELERLKNDAVKQASAVEAAAERNSMGVSYNVYITMDRSTLDLFGPEQNRGGVKYRLYKMGLGK